MKASDVIRVLSEYMAEYGDLAVVHDGCGEFGWTHLAPDLTVTEQAIAATADDPAIPKGTMVVLL